jgi:hypothetical protein
MRLTLRTLLAYLDDTLEPEQARLIGQKIAESEQARDLIERIRQVTHRRRITTAPDSGPGGKLDPNTLGEYLDNVGPDQAADVEEICLTSDTHLAEVAACHQILSLVLGEPALVPPSAHQRMYALVKGPEAIPFRKPQAKVRKPDAEPAFSRDVDDTLRLGIPPLGGRHKGNPWIMIAGGVAATALLLFAIWQVVKEPGRTTPEPNQGNNIAQLEPRKGARSSGDPDKDKSRPIVEPKEPSSGSKVDQEEKKDPKQEEKKGETKDPFELKLPPVVIDVPFTPANQASRPLGQFAENAKEPAVLLSYAAPNMEWQRHDQKNPEIVSGRPLVSLPGFTSVIRLNSGIQLTLAGSMFPELFYSFPLYESAVELHVNEQFDLDLTMRRGRIRVAAGDKPARVRVRFDNPTQPNKPEYFDVSLKAPGTEVLLDRWHYVFPEKFYRNPKDANRVGPSAHMACVVLQGAVLLSAHDVSIALAEPPGNALVTWSSFKGLEPAVKLDKVPDGLKSHQPLPMGADPRHRNELLKGRDELQKRLALRPVDVVLAETLKAPDPALRRLALCALAALDDVSAVFEQLEQDAAPDLRFASLDTLRHWLAGGRDQDYKLFDLLKTKYKTAEAESIIALLHGFGEAELMNPDTYDLLITYLDHPQLPLRELAASHLYRLVPAGQKIKYSATADPAARQQAQAAWRMIPVSQLLPMKK